jgi:ribonucleoside-diphosphate reductase alpha chain
MFINTAKAGSDTAAVSEALGRLISYILRLASPVLPSERLQDVFRQLAGIGGGRPLGFGPKRVRSLPDGLAQVVEEYLAQRVHRLNSAHDGHNGAAPAPDGDNPVYELHHQEEPAPADLPLLKIGDLCPECGQAAVVNEEGCRKCYACGYSEC